MAKSENQNLSPLEQKARDYLWRGKVRIVSVVTDTVSAEVTGADPTLDPYFVRRVAGTWTCDCPARVPECAHIIAVQLVSPPVASGASFFEGKRDPDIDALLEGL